ncbi:MAG: hypothetical protein IH600_15135 [Bacteroidetes bacterium]|nr:hypothetical protein [Bacteroidota bacterium]
MSLAEEPRGKEHDAQEAILEMLGHTSAVSLAQLLDVSNLTISRWKKAVPKKVNLEFIERVFALHSNWKQGITTLEKPSRNGVAIARPSIALDTNVVSEELTFDQQLAQIEAQLEVVERLKKKREYLLEAKKLEEDFKTDMEALRAEYADYL